MTERLYYTDAYLAEFDAAVIRVVAHEGRHAAVLDRTAFYPTSGGQPFDTGRLGSARVVDVAESDDGDILHILEGELELSVVSDGERELSIVHGTIDWNRRFEHMQQHTGQHVLSAAFDRVAGARTESFHLGAVSSTTISIGPCPRRGRERAEDEREPDRLGGSPRQRSFLRALRRRPPCLFERSRSAQARCD